MIKIVIVVGTRPNFVKIAPLCKELDKHEMLDYDIIHTGQHYDFELYQSFFMDLDLPTPNKCLSVGSGTHIGQIANSMLRLEKYLINNKPDLVIVVGDCNCTLTGALTANKMNIPLAHIEAGLRSFDESMPEEINRKLTDTISNYLFVTEPSGVVNLIKENISSDRIYHVGDITIDSIINIQDKLKKPNIKNYALLTLHRPSNVDNKEKFVEILESIREVAKHIEVVFPMHPRTLKSIKKHRLFNLLDNIEWCKPENYIDFISLEKYAEFVLTDSGGIQQETSYLGVPCLTLRDNTERPYTITNGTNKIIGTKKENIIRECFYLLEGKHKRNIKTLHLWDGKAAGRIVDIIENKTK